MSPAESLTKSSRAGAPGDEFSPRHPRRQIHPVAHKTPRHNRLVLGSGLGAFADKLSGATRIPYAKIPGFPRSTVEGHAASS